MMGPPSTPAMALMLIVAMIAIVAGVIIYTSRRRRAIMIGIAMSAVLLGVLVLSMLPASAPRHERINVAVAVDRGASVEQPRVDDAGAGTAVSRPENGTPGSIFRTIVMLAGIGVLMSFVYLFLDAGRRARYTWAIRAGSVAAFAVTCIVLWKITPQL